MLGDPKGEMTETGGAGDDKVAVGVGAPLTETRIAPSAGFLCGAGGVLALPSASSASSSDPGLGTTPCNCKF